MKSIELVLGDSLEETLSCDDIFLEYFNVFLSLPAFPQRLCYSRFTGTFHDLNVEKVPIAPIRQESESSANADRKENELFDVQGGVGSKTSVYAAKEDEKERVMKWAKEYRLPLFEETRMYRELKLCKLLLRPLDLRRGSSRIRGYSRLSMGFATTTSLVSGTGRMESPSRALTSLENQSIDEWPGSSKYEETTQSRPTSRTFSLPPTLGRDKNWSAAAIYDTSGTTNSRTVQGENDPGHSVRPRTHKRRHPLTTPSSRPQPISQTSKTNFFSDSGLGTAAMDYAQSVGTSVKTRNIATRADTLGVDSRWESEEDYDTKTPNSQIRTILTSATYQDDNYSTPPSAYIWNKGKYEGKSALRTADSPSKPHRATIVLPKTSTNPTVRILTESTGENETSETTLTSSETKQNGFDDETLYDNANDDLDDFDDDVNDYLDFDDQESSCEETETEIATIEKVHSMSMQHIKERIFRTKSGMDSFLRFLQGTAGESLVDFWFDTESFKKSVKKFGDLKRPLTPNLVAAPDDYNQENDALASLRVRRHRLFRHILERHKFLLTEEAREQIRFAQANDGLSHQVFSRTQYDVLRRLRSYWLPRFVIHKNSDPSFKNRLVSGFWDDDDAFSYNPQINILSISSLPAFSIGYLTFHDEMRDTGTNLSVLTLESATTQVIAAAPTRPSTSQMRQMSARSASYHSVMRALVAEAEAGFPLRNYLRNNENRSLANTYDFLMSLEYLTKLSAGKFQSKSQNERSSQAVILDGKHAYSLFCTFLSKDSPYTINIPRKFPISTLETTLRKAITAKKDSKSIVPVSVFRHVKNYTINILSAVLRKYQEHEISKYFEFREGKSRDKPEQEKKQIFDSKSSSKIDENSTIVSETASSFSKIWLTDDDSTETDSASTMHSFDMDRLKQLAQSIRKKGAKKSQKVEPKKQPIKKKLLRRGQTAVKSHQPSKVQFKLPDDDEKQSDEIRGGEDEAEEDDEEESSEEEKGKKKKKRKAKLNQHPNRMTFSEIKENKLLFTFFKKYVSQCESVDVQNIVQMFQLTDALLVVPQEGLERKGALSSELLKTFLLPTGPKQIAMPSERIDQFCKELPTPSNESIKLLQDYVQTSLNQAAANFSLGFGTALKDYKLTLKSDLGQHMNIAELALRTLTLKPTSKRRKALGKHSARQTPTSEHKIMFMEALEKSKEGSLSVDLVHFLKYLQGFGPQEGYPLIHNDLLFYIEVNKFIASFHEAYDLITLKRKILSIRDCFIDSQMEKTLQIDIKTGTAERLRRAMEAFVSDKGRDPHVCTLFNDAQHTVFNELLPFWAGFVTAMTPSEREGKKPMLKGERMQRRRLEAFLKTNDPQVEFLLPESQPRFEMKGIEFTFSVNSGIQWKAWSDVSSSRSSTPPLTGIIEVVKAPPTGQKRLVRRSGFNIRKLQSSKNQETRRPAFPIPKTSTPNKKEKQQITTLPPKIPVQPLITENIGSYVTSVI